MCDVITINLHNQEIFHPDIWADDACKSAINSWAECVKMKKKKWTNINVLWVQSVTLIFFSNEIKSSSSDKDFISLIF